MFVTEPQLVSNLSDPYKALLEGDLGSLRRRRRLSHNGALLEDLGRPLREPRFPPGRALTESLKLTTFGGLVKN